MDPQLVAGPAAWEAHTVIRSHLPGIADADNPVVVATRWTREFSDAAGLDRREAWSLSFARFVASYYWESRNHGDPATIERLRRTAIAMARADGGRQSRAPVRDGDASPATRSPTTRRTS